MMLLYIDHQAARVLRAAGVPIADHPQPKPVVAPQIGMELWAQFAHKALWHDFEPGWKLHKSHHVPRLGAFEDNDVFAIVNAIPAMGLCLYGFLTPNVGGGERRLDTLGCRRCGSRCRCC
jgi:hypothetical protein